MPNKPQFTVVKAHKGVGVRVTLKAAWGTSIHIQAFETISTAEARELAAALVAQADAEDAKAEKERAAEERRRKYRDREIAAERMKVFGVAEFLGRR